jgi:hypothetical protein
MVLRWVAVAFLANGENFRRTWDTMILDAESQTGK